MSTTEKVGCTIDFRKNEVMELVLGTVLLALMFVVAYQWSFTVVLGVGAFGLLVHELGHKIVGRWRCVENVHFTISPIGILIGFGSSLIIGHTLATIGGVTVGDMSSDKDRLYMALAGPVTNYIFFVVFGVLAVFSPYTVAMEGVTINLFWAVSIMNLYLGLFNLIPIPMFDGSWVYKYNKFVLAVFIGFGVLGFWFTWGDMHTELVPLFQLTRGGFDSIIPMFGGFILAKSNQVAKSNFAFHSVHDMGEVIG